MIRIRHVDDETPRHAGDARRLDPITRAPTEAPPIRMRDVLLVPWSDAQGDERQFQPVRERPVELGRDLVLVRFDADEVELLVNACLPRGHYFVAQMQDPFLYGFERELDPANYRDRFAWDSDGAIKVALQLSRLVVDNGYSTEFAARVVDHEDGQKQVVPHVMHLFRFMPTYRLREDRDWLTEEEATELRDLIDAYWASMDDLPVRVARALSLSEGVVHTGVLERALVLLMMGVEALLNTNKERVVKQLTTRMPLVAGEVGVAGISRRYSRRMYDDRSHPAHGQELKLPAVTANSQDDDAPAAFDADYFAKVARLQDLLRAIVRRAISDPEFADVFRSDNAIRARWPVLVDGVAY